RQKLMERITFTRAMQLSGNKDGKTTETQRHGDDTEKTLCDLRASVSLWLILVLNLESCMALHLHSAIFAFCLFTFYFRLACARLKFNVILRYFVREKHSCHKLQPLLIQ